MLISGIIILLDDTIIDTMKYTDVEALQSLQQGDKIIIDMETTLEIVSKIFDLKRNMLFIHTKK